MLAVGERRGRKLIGALLALAGACALGVSASFATTSAGNAREPAAEETVQAHLDPVARPTRLFLASVIGEDKKTRRTRARSVLDETEALLSEVPDDASLLMLRVSALGTAARATGFRSSVSERYGSRSRAALEDLADVLPDHPWTLVLDGVWHFEVRRRGGAMGASMLGASLEKGEAQLARAVELRGKTDAAISYAFAIALLSFDAEENSYLARLLLLAARDVAQNSPDDETAEVLLDAIAKLLKLLDDEEYRDASKLASSLL